jgi:2-polyprenylphenol 6-hydroxylase
MNTSYDVIVVGAGMVGMTAALGLAQKGLRIALVESQSIKEPTFPAIADPYDHRVVAMARASERLFEQLKVWQAMQNARVSPYEEMVVWDNEREGMIHFSSSMIFEPHLGHIVEQRVILAALWEKIKAHSAITCFFGAIILAIRCHDSCCEIDLKEGLTLFAALLVGADGAKSMIRQTMSVATDYRDYHQTAIVATLKGTLPHRATAYQRFACDGPLAWLPLADPYFTSIVWSTTATCAQRLCALSVADFNCEITRESDNKLGDLELVGERFAFPLSTHHAKQYVLPRCVLVGDAAHTIHPLAGLGVNLGLLDVVVLIELLEEARMAKRDLGSLKWLKRYERRRRWHNGMIRQTMSLFKIGFGSTSPWVQMLRNKGLNYVNQQPKIKSKLINFV